MHFKKEKKVKMCAQRPRLQHNLPHHTVFLRGSKRNQKDQKIKKKTKHQWKFPTCPHCLPSGLFQQYVIKQNIPKIYGTLLVPLIMFSAYADFLIFLCIIIILVVPSVHFGIEGGKAIRESAQGTHFWSPRPTVVGLVSCYYRQNEQGERWSML